jgi:peptidoglycan-N-acetylglucosamine deacetylase
MIRPVFSALAVFAATSLLAQSRPPAQNPPTQAPPVAAAVEDGNERRIAITVDDLPAGAAQFMTGPEVVEMTTRLLAPLKQQSVPAVGFVNERKLYYKLDQVNDFVHALRLWVENGLELGNHTYGHTGLNRVPLKDWEEAVIQGEPLTRILDVQHGMRLRFFRHPYLDVGRDLATRREAERFLVDRGYHIAPVTMDAWDWNFAGLYDYARHNGDTQTQQEVVTAYLAYTSQVFDYNEKFSRDLFGYEPKQILLLHANWLEADHLGELLELLRKRGYRFISLDDALGAAIYSMPNEYVGEEGANWLEQIAITRGRTPLAEPEFPKAIANKIRALPRPPQPVTP